MLRKKKKAFLAMSMMDLLSWLLFILAAILFYLIFKYSAQHAGITISSSTNLDSVYPSFYLLNSEFDDGISVTEQLINSKIDDNYDSIVLLLNKRYNIGGEEADFNKEAFLWYLLVCSDKDSFQKYNIRNYCYYASREGKDGFSIFTWYQTPLTFQLPNEKEPTFVKFLFAPGYYDTAMEGGAP